MAEGGHLEAEGVVEQNLLGRVGNMVVAAEHMGHAHVMVVHHHGEVVGGHTVGTAEHHVVKFGNIHGNGALHHVVEHDAALVGHAQAHHAAGTCGKASVAALAVVAGLFPSGAGHFTHGFHFFGRAVAPVGMTGFQKPVDIGVVDVEALALIGQVAVPVQAQPLHGGENGIGVFLFRARGVGIFDTQAELAAEVAGEQPAENGGTATADVQMAGGAGSESRNDFHEAHPKKIRRLCKRKPERPKLPPLPLAQTYYSASALMTSRLFFRKPTGL